MSKPVEVKKGDIYNSLEIVKELKYEDRKGSKKDRWFLYRCLLCGECHEAALKKIRSGQTKRCRACARKVRNETVRANRFEVKPNEIHNNLMFLKEIKSKEDSEGREVRMVLCRCLLCNRNHEVRLNSVRSGSTKQCKNCAGLARRNTVMACSEKLKLNETHNNLKILKEIESVKNKRGGYNRMVICRCLLCNKESEFMLTKVINGYTKQCKECSDKAKGIRREARNRAIRIRNGFNPDVPMKDRKAAERRIFATIVRPEIIIRDDGKCQMPGCSERAREVHHISKWSDCYSDRDQDLRVNPYNVICLCKECHYKAHAGNFKQEPDPEIAYILLGIAIKNTAKYSNRLEEVKQKALKALKEVSFKA